MNQLYYSLMLLAMLCSVRSAPTSFTPAEIMGTPSLPYAPYDCSVTSRNQTARTIASFLKGRSLIVKLYDRVLENLRVATTCPSKTLSSLNDARHPYIIIVEGLQGIANSIGTMDAYLRLINQSQIESYSEDMQALYDILSGTILDLYKVLSPTYCNCTITATEETNSSQCFTVPQLSISYFKKNCNLTSYISTAIFFEMGLVRHIFMPWLERQDVDPLPEITDLEWLSSHGSNSSTISKLI